MRSVRISLAGMAPVPAWCRAADEREGRHNRRWLLALVAALTLGCVPDSPDAGIPTHPSERFSVTLAWDAPATDAMGNPLGDLAGYHLYHSPSSPPDGPDGTMIDAGVATQYTVDGLQAGIYYFAVTAVDEAGNESALSAELRVEVGGP